jgi:hypothetical protein
MRRFTALLAAPLVALALPAAAQDTTSTVNEVIAYDGLLELDGAPVENDLAMRFLIDDIEGNELWRSERSDLDTTDCPTACRVPFYRGRFALYLGEHVAIPETVWTEERVGLRIQVYDEEAGWIELGGTQTIEPVPYALWSLEANELQVDRLLNALGSIDVSGDASAGSVTSDATLSSQTGSLSAGSGVIAGGVSVTTTASVGALEVDGDLTLVGNPLRMTNGDDTGVALGHGSGNLLQINPEGHFATVALTEPYVSGTSTYDGDVRIDSGAVRVGNASAHTIEADRALFLMRQVTGSNVNTHISASDYHCWIGGWAMAGADIDEGTVSNPMWAYTEAVAGVWWARGGIVSHSDEHETVDMLVVCMQSNAMTTGTWF